MSFASIPGGPGGRANINDAIDSFGLEDWQKALLASIMEQHGDSVASAVSNSFGRGTGMVFNGVQTQDFANIPIDDKRAGMLADAFNQNAPAVNSKIREGVLDALGPMPAPPKTPSVSKPITMTTTATNGDKAGLSVTETFTGAEANEWKLRRAVAISRQEGNRF